MNKPCSSKIVRSILICLFLLFLSDSTKAQFGSPNILFEGEILYADAIVSGDVDMDGDNDVIINAYFSGTVLYRNIGGGNFSSVKEQVLNSNNLSFDFEDILKIVDVDNDGDGDLVKNATWFRNNGAGLMFTVMGAYAPAGVNASGLLKDINGDGFVDDIGCSSNYVYILLNNGSGSFSIGDTLDSSGVATNVIASVQDINGDLVDDLLIGGTNAQTGWYAGTGAGHFGSRNLIAQFNSPLRSDLGDMDSDGDVDLIAYGTPGTLLWKNDGAGTFTFFDTISAEIARPLMVADVDGDNDLDFSINSGTSGDIRILRNDSGLTWINSTVENLGGYSLGGVRFEAGDMDNDGDQDLLMCSPFGLAGWYPNNGNGSIGERRNIVTNALGWGADLDAGDVDNDGDIDLITVSEHGRFVGLHINNGNGTFGDQQLIAQNCGTFYQAGFVDLNMDGLLDVITNSAECPVILNNGGSWTTDTLPGQILGPLAFDIDGDSDPDLIGDGRWFKNDGNGLFTSVYDIDIPLMMYGKNQRDLDSADFNNDGFMDYVLPYRSDSVAVLMNNGTGDFTAIKILCRNEDIDVADMDNNGFEDIVVSFSNDLWVYFNDGNGNFIGVIKYQNNLGAGASYIYTCDIDEDGDADVLSSWSAGYPHYQFLNRNLGFGDLNSRENAPGNSHTHGMMLTDINNDSRNDYVCLSLNTIISTENYYSNKLRLKGSVFADYNLDADLDSSEIKIPFQLIRSTANNILTFTSSRGDYDIGANEGTFNIWAPPTAQYYITNNPDTLIASVDSIQPVQTGLDFGIAPAQDTAVILTINSSAQITRCNTASTVSVTVKNMGAFLPTQSVVALYVHPDITVSFFQTAPDSVSGNYYYWHIDSLNWFQQWNTVLQVVTGPNNSNSTMIASIKYSNAQTDSVFDFIGGLVSCSFDPNDKQVTPEGYGVYGAIDINTDWLTYTIRFQNTGNDTAYNVVVKDGFSSDLDWTSLSILRVSHPLTNLTVDEFGLAAFRFDQIMLPDSNVDQIASNGYIKYRIRTKNNLQAGTEISNTAHIYFDLNVPVLTNTVKNTLVDCNLFTTQIMYNGTDSLFALKGDSLFASTIDKYQWFLNGDSIFGADQQFLHLDSIGSYSVVVTSVYGCAAISNLIQIGCIATSNSVSAFICDGDSLSFGSDFIALQGIYNHTFLNALGCDSIVTLNLNVSSPLTITSSGDSLITSSLGNYQWYDCNDSSIISNTTQMYYLPTLSGSYACIIDQQGCVDTTQCIAVIITTLNDLKNDQISIKPNPVHDVLHFNGLHNRSLTISISDVSGKMLMNEVLRDSEINVSHLSAGLYLVILKDSDNIYTLKFVKGQ
ncbi:MAG: T9SS type A sorting domain-containing protein [Bacteroidota bacterium]